jgi:hypothetical protein
VLVGALVVGAITAGVFAVQADGRANSAGAHAAQTHIGNTSIAVKAPIASTATTTTTPPFTPTAAVTGGLSVELNLDGGLVLFYPPRPGDEPAIDAPHALHAHDGGGGPLDPSLRYPEIPPVVLLARYTDAVSVKSPVHEVDVLAWLVIFNDVPLDAALGPSVRGPLAGYALTVVDAKTDEALRGYEFGPPLSAHQLGLG